ncbi:unnamed protein product [Caenorhabditis bovis]|uniref:Replication protein A C-terminal domain-containing protein n=1 Tax=Caenorhabditis bovis TaxID=2654633 RepID=A0A8S1F833_9PELO|nr:unnamed protein product [Caenorhabditis bovis]
MAWDASFATADAGGWHGEASFITEKKDSRSTAIGERLPVPVTITDLIENLGESSDRYNLGSFSFATVAIVGTVRSMTFDNGTMTYILQDPEDPDKEFLVVKYNNSDTAQSFHESDITEGSKIRAIGKLKNFDNTNTLLAFNIMEILDEKDYKIHILEAQMAKLFFTKNVTDIMKSDRSQHLSGMLAGPGKRAAPNNDTKGGNLAKREMKTENGGNDLSERIKTCLRKYGDVEAGIHIDQISVDVGRPNRDELERALAMLAEDGVIYPAADDNHYSII